MEQQPKKVERIRISLPILEEVVRLVGNGSSYMHEKDGLLVEIVIQEEESGIERAYTLIEKDIKENEVDGNMFWLIKSVSFRVQTTTTYGDEGLVSRYFSRVYWMDESGEEIDDDEEDEDMSDNYEYMLAVGDLDHSLDEVAAFFGPDQEAEVLMALKSA